ncbi:tetraspanin-18-like [Antedon mediterranea]|uniref:tetraspanin-18-like n=1 Tax=Antedon mediterranea TaxID=105859 RepID=UPI003AF8C689
MEGCGLSCMKYLLFVFNFIIWLGGLGMLALGLILYFGIEDWVPIEDLAMLLDNDLLRSSSYILIAAGGLVFLLAFCGCCGAIMESKCLLVFYFMILLIVFCGQLGAGILASIYSNEVEDAINDELKDAFKETYGNDTDLTTAWRTAEYILDCCGYEGYEDYAKPTTADVYSLYQFYDKKNGFDVFPESCCVGATDEEGSAPNPEECKVNGFNSVGCRVEIENLIDDYIVFIGAGAIGVACVELFCMLFAICLCRNAGESD